MLVDHYPRLLEQAAVKSLPFQKKTTEIQHANFALEKYESKDACVFFFFFLTPKLIYFLICFNFNITDYFLRISYAFKKEILHRYQP